MWGPGRGPVPGPPGGHVGPWCAHQKRLEELEGAAQAHVQMGLQPRGRAVEGVGHGQEGVGPHREELPVVGARGGDGLVGLEEPAARVPLVDDAVDVVVVAWKPGAGAGGRWGPVQPGPAPGTSPVPTLPFPPLRPVRTLGAPDLGRLQSPCGLQLLEGAPSLPASPLALPSAPSISLPHGPGHAGREPPPTW